MRLAITAFLSVIAAASPAFAEAITYSGTVGKLPIIAELVVPEAGGPAFGRYAYLSNGGDIPLHGLKQAAAGSLGLQEEKPCIGKACLGADGSPVSEAPMGGKWMLKGRAGDILLEGTWRDGGKPLAIRLERKGERPFEETPDDPLSALNPLYSNTGASGEPPVVSPQSLPYDFLKMNWPMKSGPETTLGEGTYRLDTDSRVEMDYPVVVKLGDGDTKALNAYLAQQRLQAELSAFSCLAASYLGTGWSWQSEVPSNGYDGNWSVTVEHLSPRLMGFMESGSYFCGGAHPHNFGNHFLVDARTGQPLVPEALLRGWIYRNDDGVEVDPEATGADRSTLRFSPSDELVAYVKANRKKFDAETETDCGIDDLIADSLGVYVTQDNLVFTLKDLPHVIFACTDDLLEVPLKEAKPLLTEAAAGYFAALD